MKIIIEFIYKNAEKSDSQRSQFQGKMLTIGRQGADILVNDSLCSKQHAKLIETSENLLCVEDLNSTNGTFFLGKRISSKLLKVGDTFRVGSTKLKIIDYKPDSSEQGLARSMIKDGTNKLFEAMPEEERKQFSNYLVQEDSKSGSQLNEILRRLKKSAE